MSSSGLWPAPFPHPGACIVAGFSKRIRATADASASAPLQACKKASKRHSQALWLHQPANADYFNGPANIERVRQWRARNPGYWKRPKKSADPAGESRSDRPIRQPVASLTPQGPCSPVALKDPSTPPLQDSLFPYSPVLVGLVALQSGSALQEDIRLQLDRLAQNGGAFFDQ